MKNVDNEKVVFDTLTVHQGDGKEWNGYILSDGDVYGREDDGTLVVFDGDVWNDSERHFDVPCHLKTPNNPEWTLAVLNIGNWSGISVRQVINNDEHCPKYFSGESFPDFEEVEATLKGFGLSTFEAREVAEIVAFRHKYGDIEVLYPYYHNRLIASGAIEPGQYVECPYGTVISMADPVYVEREEAERKREIARM